MKMDEGDSISEHLLKLKEIDVQFLAIGRKVAKQDMVVITLKGLPHPLKTFLRLLR
jgi:hypothetical protein